MDDTFSRFYDKAFANGHRSGYMDALEKLWDMADAARDAGDSVRELLLMDIRRQLRDKQES